MRSDRGLLYLAFKRCIVAKKKFENRVKFFLLPKDNWILKNLEVCLCIYCNVTVSDVFSQCIDSDADGLTRQSESSPNVGPYPGASTGSPSHFLSLLVTS